MLADKTIDLRGKRVLMFSYGSGMAASMYMLTVGKSYRELHHRSQFIDRLNARISVAPEDYDVIMAKRQAMYGKFNYVPEVSIGSHSYLGSC